MRFSKIFFALPFISFSPFLAAAPAHTLVNCVATAPQKLSPAITNDANDFNASSQQIYDRLLAFKAGKIDIEPSLAEKWEVSEDGLTYTFHLRKDVQFHSNKLFTPSRNLNADDVVFSFQRQADKSHPYYNVSGGTYFYYQWMNLPKILKSVEKVDDYTVKMTLNQPNSPFLTTVAMDFLSIYSKEYADKLLAEGKPELLDQQPIGTGPFEFQVYQTDQAVRYKANPNYWQGKAKFERLIFAITPDAGTRYAKLKAGECDVIDFPNIADIAQMKQDPKVTLFEREGLNLAYLGLNTQKAALDNVKVRQALQHATDKKAIVAAVFQGGGTVVTNPFPNSVLGYNENLAQYEFDLEKAKNLLAEAGYPDGFETEIWVQPVVRPSNPNPRRTAEIIQADWAKIGVKAKLVSHEWADFNKRTREGEFLAGTYGWTSRNGDPDNFLFPLLSKENIPGTNYSRWTDNKFEGLLQKAVQTQNTAERQQLYQQAVEIFQKNTPIIPIAHAINYVPVSKRVQGFVQSPFGYTYFYNVSLTE
ncbi:ABC transporter substrate-binding protein [Actinobacillus pleuropneumoniae]|uniref:ABC transporter substrate-binding protein n=2 Tax=Actinobacillus pleuropneumoniae TaxID=715 RepID=A0A9Q4DH83_ACTPL|nr:ABC transporter substrate-binding protein [Actinobacillus pleuropneumoniae]MCL7721518.1 ABC transporter substrate-binding protein [Actinobacillus pleuropneumoniae]MCL7727248.1 ABC transporter substrate-binding protein [Actinobacillus pleuropneumoniae]MCL7730441.1 ABC transporter substrate-binding protein [Actinobacillus pleuropneumoniae]MCY6367783.1 ABC transporter substrate-binding protein [Actinobacillus pleuropneumoniae]MCY6384652.1 ABC transporter substrate-binding protein [Actinobacill